jgi:hypothetical protein
MSGSRPYNFDHCDPLASNKLLESRLKSEAKSLRFAGPYPTQCSDRSFGGNVVNSLMLIYAQRHDLRQTQRRWLPVETRYQWYQQRPCRQTRWCG